MKNKNGRPGSIVSFSDKKTGKVYSTLVLTTELSADDKEKLADVLHRKIAETGRYPRNAIVETLDEMGISWDYLYPDCEIVF